MKYILMMTATKADLSWYSKWSKEDLQAQFAFMHAFNKELKDSGALVQPKAWRFPIRRRSFAPEETVSLSLLMESFAGQERMGRLL